jgi:hypothetical protein
MCQSSEVVITAVLYGNGARCSLWLTESDGSGQFELQGMIENVGDDIRSLFDRLRDCLAMHPFGVDDGTIVP